MFDLCCVVKQLCLSFDPNFVGDDEPDADAESDAGGGGGGSDAEDGGADGGGEEAESEYADGGGGASDADVEDDEDTSWKVRRAAARATDALITAVALCVQDAGNSNAHTASATSTASASTSAAVSATSPAPPTTSSVAASSAVRLPNYYTHAQACAQLLTAVSPVVMARCTERQAHVRCDLMAAYRQLLVLVRTAQPQQIRSMSVASLSVACE